MGKINKRFITFLLVALAALAGCAKDEANYSNDEDSVIIDGSEMETMLESASEQTPELTSELTSEENISISNDGYENEQQFEEALNAGVDVSGKKVTFTAGVMNPISPYGYIVYSGKKLNFCSQKDPGIKPGQQVSVTVLSAQLIDGNWIIEYR